MPSNYVGARSIEELAAALTKLSYTPRTEQQRREQSQNLYRNQLEQALLSAQQQYDTSDLALQNQLSGLETATNRRIEAQRENTRQAISQADRHALSRGMQRSTYNNAVLANLQARGNEAEEQIQQQRADTENSVAAQRALLASQLAQNRTAAQSQYENNVIASMQQMEDQDYQRGLAADQFNSNTQLQLYSAQQQDAQRAQQQAQFEAGQGLTREQMAQNQNQFDLNLALQRDELAEKIRQFNEQMAFNREKLGGSGGSGGSGGTGSTGNRSNNPGTTPPPVADPRDLSGAPASISGNTTNSTIAPFNSSNLQNLTSQLASAVGARALPTVGPVSQADANRINQANLAAALQNSTSSPMLTQAQAEANKKKKTTTTTTKTSTASAKGTVNNRVNASR